jgi:hypothetical protein
VDKPYRFVGWLTVLALVFAALSATEELVLERGITSRRPPTPGVRLYLQVHSEAVRYAPFVLLCAPALPAVGALAWVLLGRRRRRPAWLARGRSVLRGWLLAVPLAAGSALAAAMVAVLLTRRGAFGVVPVVLLGPLACAGAAIYAALVVQEDREERGASRVSAAWLAAAAIVPTLGVTGISSLGSLAVPLWVLWRSRREEPRAAVPAPA